MLYGASFLSPSQTHEAVCRGARPIHSQKLIETITITKPSELARPIANLLPAVKEVNVLCILEEGCNSLNGTTISLSSDACDFVLPFLASFGNRLTHIHIGGVDSVGMEIDHQLTLDLEEAARDGGGNNLMPVAAPTWPPNSQWYRHRLRLLVLGLCQLLQSNILSQELKLGGLLRPGLTLLGLVSCCHGSGLGEETGESCSLCASICAHFPWSAVSELRSMGLPIYFHSLEERLIFDRDEQRGLCLAYGDIFRIIAEEREGGRSLLKSWDKKVAALLSSFEPVEITDSHMVKRLVECDIPVLELHLSDEALGALDLLVNKYGYDASTMPSGDIANYIRTSDAFWLTKLPKGPLVLSQASYDRMRALGFQIDHEKLLSLSYFRLHYFL